MKLTTKQKDQIKWVVWVVTMLAMFTTWRVDRAVYKTKQELTDAYRDQAIEKVKTDYEKLYEYVIQNKEGIFKITTWIEYDTRGTSSGTSEETH